MPIHELLPSDKKSEEDKIKRCYVELTFFTKKRNLHSTYYISIFVMHYYPALHVNRRKKDSQKGLK